LSTQTPDDRQIFGITIAAVAGLGIGLVLGMVTGELMGTVDGERVRRVVRRLRQDEPDEPEDVKFLERDLLGTLRSNPTTRQLDLGVKALGGGMVEVTGTAPDERTRELAGSLLKNVRGVETVVNRVLVEGVDVTDAAPSSSSAT
jgi:hypothetical protein